MRYREIRAALNENASGFTTLNVNGIVYQVGNDLIRNGNSYAIFSGNTARQYAEANGLIVPPLEVVQAVYAQGRRLVMPARDNTPTDTDAAAHTQEIFEANGLNGFPSGLVYGHKKEVVSGPRTRIFGGIWPNGNVIQGDSSVHGGGYVDYSQGMRACRLLDNSGTAMDTTASTSNVSDSADTSETDSAAISAGPPYPPQAMQEVRDLQSKLEAAGYSVGSTGIDGKYGPRTTRAVAAFKQDYATNINNTTATTMTTQDLQVLDRVVRGTIPRVETPSRTGNTIEIDAATGRRVRSRGTSGSDRPVDGQPVVPVDDYVPQSSLFDGPESNRASVRFNNPGAMYPARWQSRYGGTDTGARIGGGHRIAMFPDRVSGAAALFGLLDGGSYRNLSVADAMRRWTGGNNARPYIDFMANNGIDTNEIIRNYLANPEAAIGLAVLMARWETGHPYPMTRSEWEEAYRTAGVGS